MEISKIKNLLSHENFQIYGSCTHNTTLTIIQEIIAYWILFSTWQSASCQVNASNDLDYNTLMPTCRVWHPLFSAYPLLGVYIFAYHLHLQESTVYDWHHHSWNYCCLYSYWVLQHISYMFSLTLTMRETFPLHKHSNSCTWTETVRKGLKLIPSVEDPSPPLST